MMAPAVVSGDCTHEHFTARATVIRLTDVEDGPVTSWSIELTASCIACNTPMIWKGLPGGSSPDYPTVSADGAELRAPCEPHLPGARP